jgi:hypothetical protein
MTMRRTFRPLLVLLAIFFLIEAWLWDHLKPVVAAVVNLVPWGPFRDWLKALIAKLPPWAALIVFVIPFIVLLPLKFLEFWFIAHRQWIGAAAVLIAAKLLGLGVTAFIFEVTRDKLLQMAWFARLYAWVMWVRDKAHELVEPIKDRIKQMFRMFAPQRAGRTLRLLRLIRRRVTRPA